MNNSYFLIPRIRVLCNIPTICEWICSVYVMSTLNHKGICRCWHSIYGIDDYSDKSIILCDDRMGNLHQRLLLANTVSLCRRILIPYRYHCFFLHSDQSRKVRMMQITFWNIMLKLISKAYKGIPWIFTLLISPLWFLFLFQHEYEKYHPLSFKKIAI